MLVKITFKLRCVFSLWQEVELISGGSSFAVTEKNKFQYLNALAEYRLARKVRSHIKSFMMVRRIASNFATILNLNTGLLGSLPYDGTYSSYFTKNVSMYPYFTYNTG